MPGYKSKSTSVWLDREATSVDFILDPIATPVRKKVGNGCDCNCDSKSSLEMSDIFVRQHMEISLLVVVILIVFFFLILRKRLGLNYPKHRQQVGSKRPTVV